MPQLGRSGPSLTAQAGIGEALARIEAAVIKRHRGSILGPYLRVTEPVAEEGRLGALAAVERAGELLQLLAVDFGAYLGER